MQGLGTQNGRHLPVPSAVSHSSFAIVSLKPFPHSDEQSMSSFHVQPDGQQSSESYRLHSWTSLTSQWTLHCAGSPTSVLRMHPTRPTMPGGACGHFVGHESPSQVSPRSTTPLPHTGAQSLSVAFVAPGGQHPSPEIGS